MEWIREEKRMSLINREALADAMYEEAFEKDSEEQKWDSGCWIRYKMFERVVFDLPSVDAVEVVRCKDCKHWNTACLPQDCGWCEKDNHGRLSDFFCKNGERRSE